MASRKPSIHVGNVFPSRNYGEFVVTEYVNSSEIKIQFQDGTIVLTNSANIKSGKVRNPNHRSIYGVGYIGQGDFSPSVNRENTKEYNAWRNMFDRCYSEKELAKSPRRRGSNVSEDWHCFQDFAKWCNDQPSWGLKGWALDKDLLIKDNVNYGPDTCCFIPTRLNTIIHITDKTPCVKQLVKGWAVQIREIDGSHKYLGSYNSELEAINVYKYERERIVRTLAELVKEILQPHVYNALITWEAKVWNSYK